MIDRLRLFEFRDHPGIGAQRRDTAFHIAHIIGRLYERDRDRIALLRDGKRQIDLVLCGQ